MLNSQTAVISRLSPQNRLAALRATATAAKIWKPNPGPQTDAFNSQADILGYGGGGGGGKTDLLLGLAATKHYRSVIFRRTFPNLREVVERSGSVFNPNGERRDKDRFNKSLHRWALSSGGMLEFEACQHEKDKYKQRGRPRDFMGIDEATEFSRTQVEFFIGWLRSTIPNQRKRVVMTFNPPIDEAGTWVTEYFLPWLAFLHPQRFIHPNPAAPGELRWYRQEEEGEVEYTTAVPGSLSRTFIPALLADNPYLSETNYYDVLNSLPEPLRSQLLFGDFTVTQPGETFKREWWDKPENRYSPAQSSTAVARWLSFDTAMKTGITHDYTACTIFELLPDYRLITRRVWRDKLMFPDLVGQIELMATEYNRDRLLRGVIIEDKVSGTSAYQTLASSAPPWLRPLLVAFIPKGSKQYRNSLASVWCQRDCVLLPTPGEESPWLFEFEGELFTNASPHDDMKDTFSQGILYLENYLSTGWHAREGNNAVIVPATPRQHTRVQAALAKRRPQKRTR